MNITQHLLYDFAKKGEFKTLKAILEVIPKLEKIAALNTLDEEKGWSPLHYAIQKKHLDIVELLLQHGTNPNLRDKYGKPLIVFAINDVHLFERPYELTEEIVSFLLDYDADPTLCMFHRINALYSALDMANSRVVYCLLNHPKVKRDLKEDLLFTFETREGHTALHKLVKALIIFSEELFENFKRCLYAFLLSGVDVKEKLPTLILHLGLGDEEYSRVNDLITEAENFLKKAKGIDRFGPGFFECYVFSTKEERHVFAQSARGLSYLVTSFHKKPHVVGKWPLEMSIAILDKLLLPFGFFKSEFNYTSHNPNATSHVSRLSL